MVTFAQAQERADEWINGDVPAYQHREVRVREFELGFVVWGEDRAEGPVSDGGNQRLVIARDSGEATLWPGLPVGEVIRRYEEEYGARAEAAAAAPEPPQRIDLNQTSFLLSPPEWLQEAADKLGIPDRRAEGAPAGDGPGSQGGQPAYEPTANDGVPAGPPPAPVPPVAPAAAPAAPPPGPGGVPDGSTPWAGTDTNTGADSDDAEVPLPATVFAPPLSGADDENTPPPVVPADAPTALMSGRGPGRGGPADRPGGRDVGGVGPAGGGRRH
ncbi:SUKH-4 family immunity protein, partial [Streptomyces sp. NPDC001274]